MQGVSGSSVIIQLQAGEEDVASANLTLGELDASHCDAPINFMHIDWERT